MSRNQALQTFFDGHEALFVRQRKEWTEILVDFETANRYEVLDPQQQRVGAIAEEAGGWAAWLVRGFLRSHRPLRAAVVDAASTLVLNLSRPFFFLFSDLTVSDADGRVLGHVRRRFGILYKKYDLVDTFGQTFATIKSPLWRLWTFPIFDRTQRQVAEITKRWSGALREIFTDADTFCVQLQHPEWTDEHRAVVFAAAISIDFDFFENNQGSDGVIGFPGGLLD